MKITAIVIASLIGVFLLAALGSALNLITILWLKFNRQVQTKRGIIERTYNTDNALAQYHWFKERAEAIKADQEKIKITQGQVDVFETSAGERKTWTFEDKTEHARLQSVVSGIKSHYQDLVAEYNARAKEVDRAIFKDALPLFFSLEAF